MGENNVCTSYEACRIPPLFFHVLLSLYVPSFPSLLFFPSFHFHIILFFSQFIRVRESKLFPRAPGSVCDPEILYLASRRDTRVLASLWHLTVL